MNAMISVYRNKNNDLKEYKVSKVKQRTAKDGRQYTMFTIADCIKGEDGNNTYEHYGVFSWQQDIRLQDGDKITFKEITALEVKEKEYQGKKILSRTIFADVNVISSQPQGNSVEVVENLPFDDNGDNSNLPF